MSLAALTAALEREAAAAEEAVLAAAREEVAAIRADVEARIAGEREQRLRTTAEAAASESAARLAEATREARRRVLEAESAWLEGIHAEVESALATLPVDRWAAAVPALVAHALRYAGAEPVTLRCAPAAEDLVWATAGARPDTTVTAVAGMAPGLVLTTDDGRLVVPLTLPDRLAARWPDLRVEVLSWVERMP